MSTTSCSTRAPTRPPTRTFALSQKLTSGDPSNGVGLGSGLDETEHGDARIPTVGHGRTQRLHCDAAAASVGVVC